MMASLYSDGERYDLVMGAYASSPALDFYQRQIACYREPVLELACGSGRLTIPLAESAIDIEGLDLSNEMLALAEKQALQRGIYLELTQGDIRNFALGKRYNLIFIAANSFQHLYTRQDVEACLRCVKNHLTSAGRLLIEIFNPSLELLARDAAQEYLLGEYNHPKDNSKITVMTKVDYDAATQINHIVWRYLHQSMDEVTTLSLDMRQFFPQEIDALLEYNGFSIEKKYGDYDDSLFTRRSPKQFIVCRAH